MENKLRIVTIGLALLGVVCQAYGALVIQPQIWAPVLNEHWLQPLTGELATYYHYQGYRIGLSDGIALGVTIAVLVALILSLKLHPENALRCPECGSLKPIETGEPMDGDRSYACVKCKTWFTIHREKYEDP